ncbi:TetR family transcriptional regulator [Mycolicibacterium aichiense]|uniref:TetR family transcriptional regulator n=1 Tax=Mycolicibacterium aichiense TaxID=1799 RepID=A0AAD1HQP8_9MYCO|nr:TetR family transcriptional regulator [Mycolicibacterium aichiense]MCV7016232.1 TetR family transcriptional regulator [Mycolicibacterium aichiense]BBX10003.1 TetR family transcriptional regulator [Mycolicibacterium aichiense]STZ26333.1 transcriptional regulator [Mycolicibacterium aichiense]
MGRWEPDAQGRLQQAAMALYTERGFDQTTVAEIAERAGLTERTFFRYFADKREVLFGGQPQLLDQLTKGVAEAPDSLAPLDAVSTALQALGATFGYRRDASRLRQAVIDANPALQERELSKRSALAAAMADGLVSRGVPETTARLTAEAGAAVFHLAFEQWLADDTHDLAHFVRRAVADLKSSM